MDNLSEHDMPGVTGIFLDVTTGVEKVSPFLPTMSNGRRSSEQE